MFAVIFNVILSVLYVPYICLKIELMGKYKLEKATSMFFELGICKFPFCDCITE
jgi:hypothetical protein